MYLSIFEASSFRLPGRVQKLLEYLQAHSAGKGSRRFRNGQSCWQNEKSAVVLAPSRPMAWHGHSLAPGRHFQAYVPAGLFLPDPGCKITDPVPDRILATVVCT